MAVSCLAVCSSHLGPQNWGRGVFTVLFSQSAMIGPSSPPLWMVSVGSSSCGAGYEDVSQDRQKIAPFGERESHPLWIMGHLRWSVKQTPLCRSSVNPWRPLIERWGERLEPKKKEPSKRQEGHQSEEEHESLRQDRGIAIRQVSEVTGCHPDPFQTW